ncbi:MAG: branched-chain amino acid ABC transporter permease [Chloroflexi bacterium]|nr:branched-chain amino acid ABC transporter permease [Chloroflexota bacterium]
MRKGTSRILTAISLLVLFLFLWWAEENLDPYLRRILNLIAINIIWVVTFNLIYGYTGQFSLGHAGFIAIGAYVTALLTLPPAQKEQSFFLSPCIWPLSVIQWPFLPSLILGALLAGVFGVLIGIPSLQLRGDYMALVTLGFAEVIRVINMNLQSITNGSLGLKGIPEYTNLFWSWGCAIFTIFVVWMLGNSSYGRAFKAIREDEIAAETTGVSIFYHKLMAFAIAALLTGVGGGLFANLISTIDPNLFSFLLSYQVVTILVLGGVGSITGNVLASIMYVSLFELLRPIDQPMTFGSITLPGRPGMRMVMFSIIFLLVILFYRRGLMGSNEFSWRWLLSKLQPIFKRKRQEDDHSKD